MLRKCSCCELSVDENTIKDIYIPFNVASGNIKSHKWPCVTYSLCDTCYDVVNSSTYEAIKNLNPKKFINKFK